MGLGARTYGIRDLSAILHAGARAADARVSEQEIGTAIADLGLRPATEAALAFLSHAFGGDDEERKADPTPEHLEP